ncbi:MAG: ChaN family lipoprotein [Magnetococcales bacterium]|nr:ChaN family lipoprotein [Magnetococcales bacterium]
MKPFSLCIVRLQLFFKGCFVGQSGAITPLLLAAIAGVVGMILPLMPIPIEKNVRYQLPVGTVISSNQLMEQLSVVPVVLVGETHDQVAHHRVQLDVLKGLHARGQNIAVGMEMFHRDQQSVLEAWTAGKLSESAFLDQTEWYFNWGMDPDLYWPILRWLRDEKIDLFALNVPRNSIRTVRMMGLEGLSESQREYIPPIQPATQSYRNRLHTLFEQHAAMMKMARSNVVFDRFVLAQTVWDGVMASAIVDYRKQHPESTVIGLVGSGHLRFAEGIPHQLKGLGQQDHRTVLPWGDDETWPAPQVSDYIWGVVGDLPWPEPIRLGVGLPEQDDPLSGVVITSVSENSIGEKLGLNAQDRIIKINGMSITGRHMMVRLIRSLEEDSVLSVTFEREGVQNVNTLESIR